MKDKSKTLSLESFNDNLDDNSGDAPKKEQTKLQFFLNLSSIIILGVLILICGLSLFTPLKIPTLLRNSDGFFVSIFRFDTLVDYFITNTLLILIPFVLTIIELISFLRYRKKSSTSSIFFIGTAITLFIIDKSFTYLSGGLSTLLVIGIILSLGYIGINIFSLIKYSEKKITIRNIIHCAISFVSLFVCLSLFFIKFSVFDTTLSIGFVKNYSFNVILSDSFEYLYFSNSSCYLVYVAILFTLLFSTIFALFFNSLKNLITNSEDCVSNIKTISLFTFFIPLLYFIFVIVNRIAISIAYDIVVPNGLGSAYVPLLINSLLFIAQCFLFGKKPLPNKETKNEEKEEKANYDKLYPTLKENILTIVFSVALFACFVVSFLLKFLIIDGYEAGFDFYETYSCYDIVLNTNGDINGFAILAFIFICLASINIALFVISLCSVFSKSKAFASVTRAYIVFCFTSVFALWIVSNYYLVYIKTTPSFIEELFPEIVYIYPMLDDDIGHFVVSSELLVPFVFALVLVITFIILKPVTKLENILNKKKMAMEMEFANNFANSKSNCGNNLDDKDKTEDDIGKITLVDDETTTFDNCPAFTELDSKIEVFNKSLMKGRASAFKNLSLPSLVEFVVNYAKNSRLHLSYSKKDIATFVAGLAACKLSILQGMSGTGKTSLPKIFLEALMGNCEIIEVESSWRDKNELLGFYNDFSKVYSPKKFTRALYKAALNPNVITFIVLDEMNLSRIEYYFSDFLSLMENEEDKREIRLTNATLFNTYDGEKHSYKALKDNHTIVIPKNIWFIGTANRDESTFEISDKVYDRGYTMNFDKRAPAITEFDEEMAPQFVEYSLLRKMFDNASPVGFSIDKCPQILECEKLLRPYNISFGNRIAKQIETFVNIYCNCFHEPQKHIDEAVETILLSKVVHKLEYKNVTNKAELIHAFKKLNLFKCVEFIETLSEDF